MGPIAQRVRLIFSGFPKNRRPFKTKEVLKVIRISVVLLIIMAIAVISESMASGSTKAIVINSSAFDTVYKPLFNAPATELNASVVFDQIVGVGDSGFKIAPLRTMNVSEMRRFSRWAKNNDTTCLNKLVPGKYVCTHYALDSIRNASRAKFCNIYFVQIYPWAGTVHNLEAMYIQDDKDYGWVFYDPHFNEIINEAMLTRGVKKVNICDPQIVKLMGWREDGSAIADVPYILVSLTMTNGKVSSCLYNTTSG